MRTSPEEVLRRDREAAGRFAEASGRDRTKSILLKAQRSLKERLETATGLRGPGAESFTATQLRATLAQVQAVLRPLQAGIGQGVIAAGGEAAERSAEAAVRYLKVADQHYRGVGSQPLALDTAAIVDHARSGANASILRRIANDPDHPGRRGVLQRYGTAVIGKFETELQQRFVARTPWADVRRKLIEASPFLQGAPAHWAERIVRTEVMGASNRANWESIRSANETLGDMCKILSCTFDNRTGADSVAVHGEIRRPEEAFESWFGAFQHPPDRPNDRAVVVPHRLAWPVPAYLLPRSDGEVLETWAREGRKGSPPPRPLMSTIDPTLFGKPSTPPAPVASAPEAEEAPTPVEEATTAPAVEEAAEAVEAGEEQVDARDRPVSDAALTELGIGHGRDEAEYYDGALTKIFGEGNVPSVNDFESMYAGPKGNGYTTKLDVLYASDDEISVGMHYVDDAKPLAAGSEMTRTFSRDEDGGLHAHHDYFKLPENLQGKGIAEEVLRNSLTKYEDMGVSRVSVDAHWVGRYTWARFGFNWSEEFGQNQVQPRLSRFLQKTLGWDKERASALAESVSDRSWAVAELQVDGRKIGKEFLLPAIDPATGNEPTGHLGSWHGEIDLADKNSPSYRQAKERLKFGAPVLVPEPEPIPPPVEVSPRHLPITAELIKDDESLDGGRNKFLQQFIGDAFKHGVPSMVDIEKMYSAGPGYTTTLTAIDGTPFGGVGVLLELKADGLEHERVKIQRTFQRDDLDEYKLHAHHDFMKLPTELQGKGIAEAMMKRSIEEYEKIGVAAIDLDAHWVGRYTWARFGFNWSEEFGREEVLPKLTKFLRDELSMSRADALDLATSVSDRSWAVAELQVGGRKIGKEFLLQDDKHAPIPNWEGTLRLDDKNHPTYQQARKRLNLP